jgi:hypothetical protein
MPKLGPHSRPGILALVDGRRAEARMMSRVRTDLIKHVGGNPSAVQRMLIDQAAMLTLRVHLMDKQSIADPELSERNGRQRLAWSNSLTRTLRELGLEATPPPKPKLLTPRQVMGLDPKPEGYPV